MDAAGKSSTVFETLNTVSCEKFGGDGRQCGMPALCAATAEPGRETTAVQQANVRLSGTRPAERRPYTVGTYLQLGTVAHYCVIRLERCVRQLMCDILGPGVILTLARHCC